MDLNPAHFLHTVNQLAGSNGYAATDRRSNPVYLSVWLRARRLRLIGENDTPDAAALGMALDSHAKQQQRQAELRLAAQLRGAQSEYRHR